MVRAHAADIDLGLEGEGPALVRGDPMLLGELLSNLIENAIAYAGPGAEATVRVTAADDVVLEVSDTGKGVPPEQMVAVRKRFSRGDNDKPGAGLGLPIASALVQLHRGELKIGSVKGEGTSVEVSIPILHVDAAPGNAYQEPAA